MTNPSQNQVHSLVDLYNTGQMAKTELTCRELLQTYPQSLIVINVLGAALQGQGKLQEAVQSYEKAIQLKPDYAEAYSNRGIALKNLGQLKAAVQSYKKAIQLKPRYAEAYSNLGVAFKDLGQLKKAMGSYEKAIKFKPDYAEAYCNRGVVYKCLGQLKKAVGSYEKAIQLKPDYAEAYCNLGNALRDLGQLKESLESCEKAIQLKPDYAEAYNNRGNTLRDLGQLKAALASYEKAIQLKPDSAEAYNNHGNVLRDLGQFNAALASGEKAIQLRPDYAEAYCNRGNALRDLGQLKEALASYEKSIQLKPDSAEAHSNRGNALLDLGQPKEALASYNKSIQLRPDYAEAYCNRGNAQRDLGQLKEALASYEKSIQIEPDYSEAYNNCGIAHKNLGQMKEAMEYCEKVIQLKPDFAKAYINLSSLKKYQAGDVYIALMENLLTNTELLDTDRIYLCFALTKAYEDLSDYDKSFSYLQEGNHLRSTKLNYNIDNDRKVFTKIREIFTTERLTMDVTPDGNTSIQPIFIVGMPRSGTSLVEQILASHTNVYGAGELETMTRIVSPILSQLPNQQDYQEKNKLSRNMINTIHDSYLEALTTLNVPEKIITDKMPHNFLWIGFILSAFPNAKIINLIRDSRAICWSIYKHHFNADGLGYAYNLMDIAEFYKLYINLMSFWRNRYPNSIYDICYEDLTERQEIETRNLLAFCHLEWEEQCLDFHKIKRVVKTVSATQVRKKMYQGSSEDWKRYEKHLQELINNLE